MTGLNSAGAIGALLLAGSLFGCAVDAGGPEDEPLHTMAIGDETLRYEVVGSMAMYQGDIILGDGPDPPPHKVEHWSDGSIPYVISEDYPPAERAAVKRQVARATVHYRERTGVELIPRVDQADYVVVRPLEPETGCGASYLGRLGGAQPLYFDSYCGFGSLLHQLGHALGDVHEHTRRDRDQFVTVRMDNVEPGREHLFDIAPGCFDDAGDYDYWSVMHGWAGEAATAPCDEYDDRGCTMVSRQGVDHYEMGQRNGLSRGDAKGLCALYGDPTELDLRTVGSDPVRIRAELQWRWAPDAGAVRIVSDRQGVLFERLPLRPGYAAIPLPGLESGRHVLTFETLQRCHSQFEHVVDVP